MRGRYQDLLPSSSVGKTSLLLSKAVGGGRGRLTGIAGFGAAGCQVTAGNVARTEQGEG